MMRTLSLFAGAAALASLFATGAYAGSATAPSPMQLASNNDSDQSDASEDNPDVVPDSDVDAAEAEIRQQLHDAQINVIRRGNLLVVSMGADILFTFDSYDVSNEGAAATKALARILVRRRRTTVEVNGYTDTMGSPEYNDQLSANRARAVADIMVADGVDPARISAHGFGETHLAVETGDQVKEIKNRRVEIVLHLGRHGLGRGRHHHRHGQGGQENPDE